MPTRSRRPTPELVEKWIKRGFGCGQGKAYKPFLAVRDVPSEGTSSMVSSRLTGRVHHYLSDLELQAHLLAEYDPGTLDIREQYALVPWSETQAIANHVGVQHPHYPGTRTPTVLTTDLLISTRKGDRIEHRAISVKPFKTLSKRDMAKLWIEQRYWRERGVEWKLLQAGEAPNVRALNLKFFEMAPNDDRVDEASITPASFSQIFESLWSPEAYYIDLLTEAAKHVGVDVQTAQALLGQSVWSHCSRVDIDSLVLRFRSPLLLRG